jgi:hypothetical protein
MTDRLDAWLEAIIHLVNPGVKESAYKANIPLEKAG